MRGETKSLVAMSLLARPSVTSRTTSSSVGVRDAQPLVGRLPWEGEGAKAAERQAEADRAKVSGLAELHSAAGIPRAGANWLVARRTRRTASRSGGLRRRYPQARNHFDGS